jgi:hypothetical protein
MIMVAEMRKEKLPVRACISSAVPIQGSACSAISEKSNFLKAMAADASSVGCAR